MNRQKTGFWMVIRITLVLVGLLLLAGCSSRARVGALRSESQTVELGDTGPVRVEIQMGAGVLEVTSGAEELLEADFTYNVDKMKPEVKYSGSTLVVQHPEVNGLPALQGITDFRNEWDLRFNDDVAMDLSVEMGAGTSELKLAGLALTGADISQGVGNSTIDLRGNWAQDLEIAIDAGATDITVLLPKDIGVQVTVDAGIGRIEAPGLAKDDNVYTNAAYGISPVTMQLNLQAGIGQIKLEVEE